ncbi:hypothetical protein HQ535_02785 [bacterium]|nr:hypothetical protein [bacterium]
MRRLATPIAALAVAAAACAPSGGVSPSTTAGGDPSTTTVPGVGGRPGEVVVGLGTVGSPRILNPLLDGPDTAVLDLIAPAVFATGWYFDGVSREPVPNLLAEIPSLENGGLEDRGNGRMDVTVRVVDGAVWADGEPITADDLLFTYQVIVDQSNPIRSDVRERYDTILPGTLAADGQELRFRMETSLDVTMLFDIILPQHEVENSDFAADWGDTMWVSGGPFELASWQPGQYLELRRNPRYWKVDAAGGTLPRLDRVVIRFFESGPTVDPRLRDTFMGRDLDVAIVPDAQGNLSAYEGPVEAGVATMSVPGVGWEALVFQFGPNNRNTETLNSNLAFRQAVAHAIDRTSLAEPRATQPLYSAIRLYRL